MILPVLQVKNERKHPVYIKTKHINEEFKMKFKIKLKFQQDLGNAVHSRHVATKPLW